MHSSQVPLLPKRGWDHGEGKEHHTGGASAGNGMVSGILPQRFGRSDIPDRVELIGESEYRTTYISTVQEPA